MASARADHESDLATAGISIGDADGAEAGSGVHLKIEYCLMYITFLYISYQYLAMGGCL